MGHPWRHLHRSLFGKYFAVLFVAVVAPLLAGGIGNAWFGYRDQRAMLDALLRLEATSAAGQIRNFLDGIRDQLGWTVQQDWSPGSEEQHRRDAFRVLRQAPAVTAITLVDQRGIERLHVSRVDLNRGGTGIDRSADPAVSGARAARAWYGPVTYSEASEPFMVVAVAGNRPSVGIALAEVNLKLIRDVITGIRIGAAGHAFVTDRSGRLVAHPDITEVLRGTGAATAAGLRALRAKIAATGGTVAVQRHDGDAVLAAMAPIAGVEWTVFVEQPVAEALAPIHAALWRTGGLMLAGTLLAGLLAYGLARRMTGPIRLLEEGTERIGAGHFGHRIEIRSGDELERLAFRFNQMAEELALSQERSERIARLRRFLAPQVAELVERAGDDSVLAGQRALVVAVFCDLRGFTHLSARSPPEQVMAILHDYYAALGRAVTRYEATLISFAGDGMMVLVNAPVPVPDPAYRALAMAIDMQAAIQQLIAGWRARGCRIGFGVGLAMGHATVGQIGTASRVEYTAIGNVVNLAARLCEAAGDGQILADRAVALAVGSRLPLTQLGPRPIKGYEQQVTVYGANLGIRAAAASAGGPEDGGT
jgi:class 3 adenylate cyclase